MFESSQWFFILGLGAIWLGLQIIWVAPLPRQLRQGETPTAPKGSPEAFGLFWIDQYGWIGITLSTLGTLAVLYGILSA